MTVTPTASVAVAEGEALAARACEVISDRGAFSALLLRLGLADGDAGCAPLRTGGGGRIPHPATAPPPVALRTEAGVPQPLGVGTVEASRTELACVGDRILDRVHPALEVVAAAQSPDLVREGHGRAQGGWRVRTWDCAAWSLKRVGWWRGRT